MNSREKNRRIEKRKLKDVNYGLDSHLYLRRVENLIDEGLSQDDAEIRAMRELLSFLDGKIIKAKENTDASMILSQILLQLQKLEIVTELTKRLS